MSSSAQTSKARKLPTNNLAMHDMFARVSDVLDKKKIEPDKDIPMGSAKFEKHLDNLDCLVR